MKILASICGTALILFTVFCSRQPKHENKQSSPAFSQELTVAEAKTGLLTAEILWKFGRIGESNLSPDKKNLVYSVTRYDININKGNTDLFIIAVSGGEPKQITNTSFSEFNARWKPDGTKIGFLSAESGSVQLWEMKSDGSEKAMLSNIEGGINSFEYAPVGGKIYYTKQVKVDKAPSDLYPDLPLAKVRIYDDLMVRHWNDWNNYQYSHIFIANIENGKLTGDKDIMPGEAWDAPLAPDFESSDICWSPDGKTLTYTSKKLHGKEYAVSTNSDIYLYYLETGNTINFTDGMPGYDRGPVFSPDGKFLAWTSMATAGYESDKDRLFIREIASGKAEYLTETFDQSVSNPRWSDDGKSIYFISGTKGTVQLFLIETAGRQVSQITKGIHDYTSMELAGGSLIASRMSMSQSTEIYRVDPKSGEATKLTTTNKNIYDKISMGEVKERWVKTTDKKNMLVWVIYPPGFDSTKRYPAVLFCEGGPHSMVSQFFNYRWNLQLMAAHGYIVIAPNRRGLPGFGQQWNDEIAGDYGGQNIKDYLSAVDDMKKEKYIDGDRFGAVGASYGGYSVYYLAGHHEKRFKAFIAHCGMFNFESFYGATEEIWFPNHDMGGSYWQNPPSKSYAFSPHKFVDKWDTPIMIITGEYDFRIPYTESLQAFTAARMRGIPSRLLVFPEETHFVTKPQNSILWQREFFAWLDKYLKQ
jgi:dipeptidyl aminopeptidase/acylaminoacyl peptidase